MANTSNATNTANTGLSGTDDDAVYPIQGLTADRTTQDLRMSIEGSPRAHVTGLLVRAVAIPEPPFFSITALGTMGLLVVAVSE